MFSESSLLTVTLQSPRLDTLIENSSTASQIAEAAKRPNAVQLRNSRLSIWQSLAAAGEFLSHGRYSKALESPSASIKH